MPGGGETIDGVTPTTEGELELLRARVFGPDADGDPDAIRRLQELEAARRPVAPPVVEEPPVAPIEPPQEPPAEPVDGLGRTVLRRVLGVRRSTVLILVALVTLVAMVVTALTLVQRVQTDPLQAGAEQVARLGVDSSFRMPDVFRGGDNGDVGAQGFHTFKGLRAVIMERGFFGGPTEEPCMGVYPEANVTNPESDSFDGPVIGGCGMGGFPAIAQFSSELNGFPEELRDAYPGYGFQFVYDTANNEVVVFALR